MTREHSLENLTVAKIVSTPTAISWSQAYNAGGFFVLFSLAREEETEEDELSHLGKTFLNNLEAEYFSLEEKSLESIKKAISSSVSAPDQDYSLSLVVVSIINDILYVFSKNGGKVFIKRDEEIGEVSQDSEELSSFSGFLKDKDTIILETKQFNEVISKETLKDSLDHFSAEEIAENLSPKIHEANEGGAGAIFINYLEIKPEENEKEEEVIGAIQEDKAPKKRLEIKNYIPDLKFQIPQLALSKRIYLGVGIALALLLVFGVLFTINKQKAEQSKILFEEIYSPALKKFDEGEALLSLNKNLARDDLTEAKKILQDGAGKFKKDSKEAKQIEELLGKVEKSLTLASDINSSETKEAGEKDSPLLSLIRKESASFGVLEGNNIYLLTKEGVSQTAKTNESSKVIIKKDWEEEGGLGTFMGNVYVLDKKAGQIYKYVSPNFGKTNYLSQSADLSKSVSMAIDSSVWILQKDGTILKFLRGKAESFNISGLDKPLSGPTRIFTNRETNNLYVLEPLNQRIVVLNKEGAYQSQYQSGILKSASDFEVLESSKKIFILSSGKIYQIDLK